MRFKVTFKNYKMGCAGGGMRCFECGNALFPGQRIVRIFGVMGRSGIVCCVECMGVHAIYDEMRKVK